MQRQDNQMKKALLVVSFGTTHEETRAKTIDRIEEDLAAAFPDRKLYRGWTSRMIVKRLAERGTQVDTLEDALARMQEDGMTDILVQPTHIMEGAENDRMLEALDKASSGFESVRTGLPLLSSEEDLAQLARILGEEYLADGQNLLLLMGHGSAKKPESNRIYREMQEAFRKAGIPGAYVGTVEGTPTFDDVLGAVAESGAHCVTLAPMMIVAGDHAKNDMAGEDPSSWKNQLEAEGFQVRPVLRGLGEYPAVRQMLVQHAEEAV